MNRNTKRSMVLWAAVLLAGVATSNGSILIDNSGVSVTASTTYNNSSEGPYYPTKLIDGSGLDINGPGTHSTVSNNSYSGGQHGTMWMSTQTADAWLIFDLGQVYADLDYVKIWNWNWSGYDTSYRCAKNVNIYVSDTPLADGDAGWTLDSQVVLNKGPGDDVTPYGDIVPINTANVRYIDIHIVDSYDAIPYIGLSEVQFYDTPEPATIALLGMGLFGLIRRRK